LTYLLPIKTTEDSLEVIGGKGRSLARLSSAGFSVPGGFQVKASAYKSFIADNRLQSKILEFANPELRDGLVSFDPASSRIRQLFNNCQLKGALADEIVEAYGALDESRPPVAVRSSANAEDLPELSFAGQQETYLNVQGADAVIAAIRNCWASLWTAQAINYRHEMGVENDAVAMAVIVQVMVPSEVSGILFTANPSNGERSELIINCSFGLGEAVVSGQVTPDTYIVDRESGRAKETVIGAKEQMIVSDGEQGTRVEIVAEGQREISSLSDAALTDLTSLAIDVEKEFEGVPQDIEWAISEGKLWLLQARPITHLPAPPPKDVTWPEIPWAHLLKRQVAENMPDPLSPLFEDLYLKALFDAQTWPDDTLWEGSLTRNVGKNFVVATVNGYAYQSIPRSGFAEWEEAMKKFAAWQAAQPWHAKLKRTSATAIAPYIKSPAIVDWENRKLPVYLEDIDRWRKLDPTAATGEELLLGMKSLAETDARYWMALRGVIGAAKMTDGGLQSFLEKNAPDEGLISGTFLSGFPSRALDAEVDMRAIADRIRANRSLYELTIITPARRFLGTLQQHPQGKPVCDAIGEYLNDYGKQVFNLDFVEACLAEEPLPFVMSLKALVRDAGYDLLTRQLEVKKTRRSKWIQALKFFRGKQRFRFLQLYYTARINYPAREEALYFMGAAWAVFRPYALELGRRLVRAGTFGSPDDVFYLTSKDLMEAIMARADDRALPELGQKAADQRALRALRFRMKQPQTIPEQKDDSKWATQRQNEEDSNTLRGFAVSPGTVSAEVSLIMSPNDFDKMKPGTILVCPLTTPAWTQLFPHAVGLVTDIGSILAHGSIVAREYGIPAVLGVGDVTQRVKSGQRITIDGDRGTVTVDAPGKRRLSVRSSASSPAIH